MDQSSIPSVPLYRGATRVPTFAGVPAVPLATAFIILAAFATSLSPWFWLAVPPTWITMAAITRTDDRAFRILGLWIDTKMRNQNKAFWRASSYSPLDYPKTRKLTP
ncbi:type IV secretion system protein VirB3 [Verticiella alkaliphila]|uniref:type IV secretion system protein VirB3 n=1 Tax=Verticiella alkaliphila TaxID=2779529 RepID=UPI00353004F5